MLHWVLWNLSSEAKLLILTESGTGSHLICSPDPVHTYCLSNIMQVVTPGLQTVVLCVNWDSFEQETTLLSMDLSTFNMQQCCKSRYADQWLELVEFGGSTQNWVVPSHDPFKYNSFLKGLKCWCSSLILVVIGVANPRNAYGCSSFIGVANPRNAGRNASCCVLIAVKRDIQYRRVFVYCLYCSTLDILLLVMDRSALKTIGMFCSHDVRRTCLNETPGQNLFLVFLLLVTRSIGWIAYIAQHLVVSGVANPRNNVWLFLSFLLE